MIAVSWVALTKVLEIVEVLKLTVELEVKLLPIRVIVVLAAPAEAVVGLMLVKTGVELLMANVRAEEVPPPGVALTTVMEALPDAVNSEAGTRAVNSVTLTKVVVSGEELKSTVEPLTNPLPVIVSVLLGPLTASEVGLMEDNTGRGLTMEKVWAAEVPPPGVGVTTVIEAVPAVAKSAMGMVAVNCVELMKTVAIDAPLNSAVEDPMKLVPVKLMARFELPAVAEVVLMLVSVGAGLSVAGLNNAA